MKTIAIIFIFMAFIFGSYAQSMEQDKVPYGVVEYAKKHSIPRYRVWDVSASYSDLLKKGGVYLLSGYGDERLFTFLLVNDKEVFSLTGIENAANVERFLLPRYKDLKFTEKEAAALASDIVKLLLANSKHGGLVLDELRFISAVDLLEKNPHTSKVSIVELRDLYKKPIFRQSEGGGAVLRFIIFTPAGSIVECDIFMLSEKTLINELKFRVLMPEGSFVYPYSG